MKQTIVIIGLVYLLAGCASEPETLEEFTAAGKKAFAEQNFDQARNYLGQAVALAPSDKEILFLLGYSYQRDLILDSALFYLKRADLLFPDDREINQQIYAVARALKDWDYAIVALRVLIKTGDPEAERLPEMAELYYLAGYGQAMVYSYNKLVVQEPDNPLNYLRLAQGHMMMQNVDSAIVTMDASIKKFGEKQEFLNNKATFLVFKGKDAEAEIIFRRLTKEFPDNSSYRLSLANALSSQDFRKKKSEALSIYETLPNGEGDPLKIDSLITALKLDLGRP